MRWFILRIKGKRALDIIHHIGEDLCWKPTKAQWTKPARKHKPVLVEIDLIPGWLFVKEEALGMESGVQGVHGTLKYGRLGLLWVEDEDLDELRAFCSALNEAAPTDPTWVPSIGDMVSLRGVLGQLSGRIVEIRGQKEFLIDTGFFPVWAHLDVLKPAE